MKKNKTLVDVAAAAGVSKMTASRALRGDKDVSQSSIDRVRKAAREIGYSGNHLAASLSSKRTDLIGVVVPSLANIVFPQVVSGITGVLADKRMQPVFGVTDYDTEREYDIVRGMLSWRPSGLIVTGMDQSDDTRRLLSEADIPVVQIMDSDGTPIDGCVGLSHFEAGYQMGTALLGAGRCRMGYIGCNLGKDLRGDRRRRGFAQALQDQGLPLVTQIRDDALSSVATGRQLTERMLADHPDLDCIYFSNDDLAVGALGHCISTGITVPDQLVLAGFNGLDLIEAFPGKIATSRTLRREIGQSAARFILDRLAPEAQDPEKIRIFQPEILLGDLANQGS